MKFQSNFKLSIRIKFSGVDFYIPLKQYNVNYKINKLIQCLSPLYEDTAELLDHINDSFEIYLHIIVDFNNWLVKIHLTNHKFHVSGHFPLHQYNFSKLILYFEELVIRNRSNVYREIVLHYEFSYSLRYQLKKFLGPYLLCNDCWISVKELEN